MVLFDFFRGEKSRKINTLLYVALTNAACEGLFGRLKNEMFYHRDWTDVRIQKFIDNLNDYLIWYNQKRIKQSLGNMSPREYRQNLGLTA